MPQLTENVYRAPGHQRPNFDGFICIHYAAPPYSARISAIYLFPFGNLVRFHLLTSVCNAWQRSRTQNLQRVGKNSGPIVCGPKFVKLSDDVEDPSYFPTPLPDCLYRLSFRRYSPSSLTSRRKNRTDVNVLAPIFGTDDPDFSTAVC